MITSRYPIWRTNPAGFAISGHWPILTGILAVLVGPVILGTVLIVLTGLFIPASGAVTEVDFMIALETFGILLVGSPFLSWLALAFAIPVSAIAASRGYAGWGVAVAGGFLAGMIIALFMNGFSLASESLLLGVVGLILALFYWGGIRLIHPKAMGVGLINVSP